MNVTLEVVNLVKSFPGVKALDDVSMRFNRGEVVGIIGENGAGKSTLLKILTGVHLPDSGEILINGSPVQIGDPRVAAEKGIAMVFQEQSILSTLSVAENIFLGREQEFTKHGFLNVGRLRRAAQIELEKVQLDINPATSCARLSFSERQLVELAKALSIESRIDGDIVILLDEPTSVLEEAEIELLFKIIRDLKSRAAFAFISHRLEEVLAVSDRVYVMRDGRVVGENVASEASLTQLHQLMVGRQLQSEYYRESLQQSYASDVALKVTGLGYNNVFKDISFSLRRGEILGIAGVIGSGREELVQCLAGLKSASAGTVEIDGQRVSLQSPHQAVAGGIGYLPRERKSEGIVGLNTVAENMTMASIDQVSHKGLIQFAKERALAREWVKKLNIKTPSVNTTASSLSGGNQQKVVLSKWQVAGSRILILDHPTRGIDVGAKEDVYELVRDMSAKGIAIILLADTLEEIIGLSHTILTMRDGVITQQFNALPGEKPEQVALVSHMV